MIGTIRKHSSWLWVIVVVTVISSFVFWSDVRPKGSSSGGGDNYGSLYGKPVARDQYLRAVTFVEISELMQGGRGRSGMDKDGQIRQQLLLQAKVDELGIQVSDAAVGGYIRETFKDPSTGIFNYDSLMKNLEEKARIDEPSFLNYSRQQLAIQHLVELMGSAGKLVTPREADAEFRTQNEQYVASVALFSSSNLMSTVTAKPEELTQFYSNRIVSYRIPERLVLVYVRFDASNHLAESRAQLAADGSFSNRFEQFYTQRGAETFRDDKEIVLSKAAAFAKTREEAVEQGALEFARRLANKFNEDLGQQTTVTTSDFAKTAAKLGVALRTTLPFRAGERIVGLESVTQLSQRVSSLDAETPYTEPLDGNGFIIIPMLQTKLPAETSAFASVKDRVTRDFKMDRARTVAREKGQKFAAGAASALKSGTSFAQFAETQKISWSPIPPFSMAMQSLPGLDSRLNLYSVRNAVMSAKTNEVGTYTETQDGGMVVFLADKRPVTEAEIKTGMAAALEDQRQRRKMSAFQGWFAAEFKNAGLAEKEVTPGMPMDSRQ